MKKSMIARAAAVVCSIASLAALGIAAAAQTDIPVEQRKNEFIAGKVNVVAGQVKAEPGEKVTFPVYIQQNTETGFAAADIRLTYDEELTVCLKSDGQPQCKMKDVAVDAKLSSIITSDPEEHTISVKAKGKNCATGDGVIFTVDLATPEEPTKRYYAVSLEINTFTDDKNNPVPAIKLDGYIEMLYGCPETGPIVPMTTAPTIESTKAPTTGTTEGQTSVSTTELTAVITAPGQEGAATAAPGQEGEVTTTSAQAAAAATTSAQAAAVTTTTKAAAAVTTTKSGSSDTSAAKTGDAGVGVAVAGFMLAAAAAVAATKKKKDN